MMTATDASPEKGTEHYNHVALSNLLSATHRPWCDYDRYLEDTEGNGERYTLEDVRPMSDEEAPPPRADDYCRPVSEDSPLWVGTDPETGQTPAFRVGFDDCGGEEPAPQIGISDAPEVTGAYKLRRSNAD